MKTDGLGGSMRLFNIDNELFTEVEDKLGEHTAYAAIEKASQLIQSISELERSKKNWYSEYDSEKMNNVFYKISEMYIYLEALQKRYDISNPSIRRGIMKKLKETK